MLNELGIHRQVAIAKITVAKIATSSVHSRPGMYLKTEKKIGKNNRRMITCRWRAFIFAGMPIALNAARGLDDCLPATSIDALGPGSIMPTYRISQELVFASLDARKRWIIFGSLSKPAGVDLTAAEEN